MWYYISPQIVFGEAALEELDRLQGRHALIVTDEILMKLGIVDKVSDHLKKAGFEISIFSEVEPEPCPDTVCKGAQIATEYQPDWIIGLGGGSAMDAAKGIWILYERPDLIPEEINPLTTLGLRKKARLCTIPTTSGTGAEATWAIVLTNTEEKRKMGLGNRENIADLAIVDPSLAVSMPARLTADTGMDALAHGIEGYTCNWHSDLSDGQCMKAVQLIFQYLPRAIANGNDMEAREHLHNAATCAGLGFGNAMASLGHALGHSMGACFHTPHGRAVGIFLPYSIDFCASLAPARFAELAALIGCSCPYEEEAAHELSRRVRELAVTIGSPTSMKEAGIDRNAFEANLDKLTDGACNDTQLVTSARMPSFDEVRMLFEYAYEGKEIDF